MRQRGLRVTAEGLRQDVQRRLVANGMPSLERPGRGRDSKWNASAVRRVAYLARLRRRGANGHVIPLLAFIRDGWGWHEIRGTVARAARRQALIDRRSLNQPSRVRQEHDLFDNVDQAQSEDSLVPAEPLREARHWLASVIWYGRGQAGTSLGPYLLGLARELDMNADHNPDARELDDRRDLVERLEQRRDELGLRSVDLAEWLMTIDDVLVERGRRVLRWQLREFRRFIRGGRPLGGSSNPLTMFGKEKHQMAADLRHDTGRPTAAQMLGSAVAAAMFSAALTEELPEFEI